MKIYIASSLHNAEQVRNWRDALAPFGITLTFDWTQPPTQDRVKLAALEMAGIRDAEAFILLLPGRKGAHVELGAALALGIPAFLVGDINEQQETMDGPEHCIFYHHSALSRMWRPIQTAEMVEALRRAVLRRSHLLHAPEIVVRQEQELARLREQLRGVGTWDTDDEGVMRYREIVEVARIEAAADDRYNLTTPTTTHRGLASHPLARRLFDWLRGEEAKDDIPF